MRKGGRLGPTGYEFELSGGNPALDLANTVDVRPTSTPRDLLPDYAALLDWALQAGLVEGREFARLSREAAERPSAATASLQRARELREAIFRVFSAVARRAAAPERDLETLNAALSRTLRHARIAAARGGYAWEWTADRSALDRPLWPVVRAAADLLASDERSRVRECAAKDCAWLFFDRSKNGTRRWCDMSVCGNREKARRFQRRLRAH